jgi:hypothetical protein
VAAVPHQEWIREFSTALAAGRDLNAPPPDAPGPFSLAEPDVIHSVLTAAGYTEVTLDDQHQPMWFGTDTEDAYQLVLGLLAWMLEGLDDNARANAHAACAPPSTPTPQLTVSSTTQQAGSSAPLGHDPHLRSVPYDRRDITPPLSEQGISKRFDRARASPSAQ